MFTEYLLKMARKFLITGATGFIGSMLLRKLISINEDVEIILRENSNTVAYIKKSFKRI